MQSIVVGGKGFEKELNKVLSKYEKAIAPAMAETLSVAAFRGRKAIQAGMPDQLHNPTKQMMSNAAHFVKQAEAKDGIDKMQALVYLSPWANEVLRPNILGETIYELYGNSEVLVPHISNLQRPEVTRKLGKIVNAAGNLIKFQDRGLDKIRSKTEYVFEIDTNAHPWLRKGGYFRNKQRNGKGKGLFTLWTFKESAERKAKLDYFGLGTSVYASSIQKEWPIQLQKQIARYA